MENPEEDAKKKLAKVLPTTLAGLEGRWIADSTFSVEDVKSTGLGSKGFQFEIFSDSSVYAVDSLKLVFPGRVSGRVRLSGDTLFIVPSSTSKRLNGAANPDTFLVNLRFLGNRLELDHPVDQRFSFFHKMKWIDSTVRDSLLKDSLWMRVNHWVNPDSSFLEPLVKNFQYLRFPNGKMLRDQHVDGIFLKDTGSLFKLGSRWTWTTNEGDQNYQVNMINNDSLRIWHLNGDRSDSGFELYKRVSRFHPLDLDISSLLGHMRTDSIRSFGSMQINHFGNVYDLEFNIDHSVQTETNMTSFPKFLFWTLDTGKILLRGEGEISAVFRIDTTLPKIVKLSTDLGRYFSSATDLFQTKVDASRYPGHPLERFDAASFVHIRLGSDTLRFYFLSNFVKGSFNQYEIQRRENLDTNWVTFKLLSGQETFTSSQPGFRFMMEGKNSKLGGFTCRSDSLIALVIRVSRNSDPTLSQGLIQGQCKLISTSIPSTDTLLDLQGEFRFKLKKASDLQSPLWVIP